MQKLISCVLLTAMLFTCSSRKPFDHDYFSIGVSRGILDNKEINEASGLVASIENRNLLWTHNDSGDQPRIFLIDNQGRHRATVNISGIVSRDWEDIAIGPGPEKDVSYLYVGDIGDNFGMFEHKYIYRLKEPTIKFTADSSRVTVNITQVDSIKLSLSDRPRDTEAMFVDPATKDIYLFSKREEKEINVYILPYPQSTTEIDTAELIMKLPHTQIVAADISQDGQEILLKNYKNVFYWKRKEGESIPGMLKRPAIFLPYAAEPQGEAITFSISGDGYYTVSEMANNKKPHLMFYQRNTE